MPTHTFVPLSIQTFIPQPHPSLEMRYPWPIHVLRTPSHSAERQQAATCHENSHISMYNQWVSVLLQGAGISSAFLIKCLTVSKQLWGRSVISADAVCLSSSCLHKWTYGLLAQGQLTQSLIRYNFSLFDVSDTKICPLAGMPLWYRNLVSLWIDSCDEEKEQFCLWPGKYLFITNAGTAV